MDQEAKHSRMTDSDGKDVECHSGKPSYMSTCIECQARVVIHCEDCSIKVTLCSCTLGKRIAESRQN